MGVDVEKAGLQEELQNIPVSGALYRAGAEQEMQNIPVQGALERTQMYDTMTGIGERAPVRNAFYESALDFNPNKYAQQAGAQASMNYDAGQQGMFNAIARRGGNPENVDVSNDSMHRAMAISRASTDARNWAEQESFNRLNAAANSGAMG